VVVVDDGVETGTAARAIAHALRTGNPARLVLAVPVCPRQEGGSLALLYDEVIAVVQPLARRSLRWHYANADWLD
jgi:putative phosphoribosyl transferase